MNKKVVFILGFFCTIFLTIDAQSDDLWSAVSSGLDEVQKDRDARIASLVKDGVKKVEQTVKKAVTDLQANAINQVGKIKQNMNQEIKEVQSGADHEIMEIAQDAEQDLKNVKHSFDFKAESLKNRAVSEVMSLISDAEEVAFKLGREKRDKIILDKLQKTFENPQDKAVSFKSLNGTSFQIAIPSYWKKQVAQDFYKSSAKLEQIVLDAENDDQAKEFVNCFKDQKEWFDKTLSSTKYTSDPGYVQIIHKKVMMDNMTSAVNRAEAYLNDWTKLLNLMPQEKNQIKLLFLYDVNSDMLRLQNLPYESRRFTDEEVKILALKITNDVTGRAAKAFPDVDFVSLNVSAIPRDLHIISQINEDLSELKTAAGGKKFEPQMVDGYLKKLNSDLANLVIQLHNDGQKREELKNKIGYLESESLTKDEVVREFKTELMSKDKFLKSLSDEIEQTKIILNELRVQNTETSNKINFVETMAELRLREQAAVFKNKFATFGSSNRLDEVKQLESINKQSIERELIEKVAIK